MTKKEFIAIANYDRSFGRYRTDDKATMLPMQGGKLFIEWEKNICTIFPENDRPGSFSNRTWDRYYMFFVDRKVSWELDYNMVMESIDETLDVLREAGMTIRKGEDVIEEYLANRNE